ncbi:hypothetical protein Fot_35688 [Forsythia ovata]|uniref:Uncharacterized protein n=1 Tax=Forsythia ovata TaxID=205694 RepID=A0ABD1SMJ4_9LAMI
MAAGADSFLKTVGSSSSQQDPMLMYSYLPAGGGTGVRNASSPLSLSDEDTDPRRDGTEGIYDVTSGTNGMKEELHTIVFGVYKTVTPRTDAVEDIGGGGEILSTTPPRLILSLGMLEK